MLLVVKSARVYTSSNQLYRTLHRSLLDAQGTVFKVKAAHDAMISLLSVPSNFNAPSYEIVIGANGNTMTVLHLKSELNDVIFQVYTPNILNADELRSFWVSWLDGMVHFGTGEVVGQNALLNYTDPQPLYRKYVHSIAVASGTDVLAEWEIGELFDTSMYI